jgi:uncharacterized protein with GYD domain|tara:strand:- start:14 stop:322 length:309 start_codon:yes stop_codon:yes gene_type:complete
MNITLLGAYTPAALKGLMSGSDRKAAVESALAAVGGTLEHLAFTRGGYDVVVRATVPDSASLVGLVVAIKATGAFEKADYLEEIDISAVLDVSNKVAYTPPA